MTEEVLMSDNGEFRGFRVRLTPTVGVRSGKIGIYKVRPIRRAGPSWVSPAVSRHARPVIVKTIKLDRSRPRGANAITNEIKYASKEGPLFERGPDGVVREADPKSLMDEWQYDRLVYHVVVSPNDGAKLTDPNEFARATLAYWEQRTGPLQAAWAIEEKPDRAHPEGNRHVHFVVRGEQDGHDLEFSAHMLRRGFREGAREAATDQLGYMTVRECQQFERQLERGRWEKEQERQSREDERSLG
jgi:type IV secretory pathway VirD2 relaxase